MTTDKEPVLEQGPKLFKKKVPCTHPKARHDGNADWPGLICARCGAEVDRDDYELS